MFRIDHKRGLFYFRMSSQNFEFLANQSAPWYRALATLDWGMESEWRPSRSSGTSGQSCGRLDRPGNSWRSLRRIEKYSGSILIYAVAARQSLSPLGRGMRLA